jgi:hypothetical protein
MGYRNKSLTNKQVENKLKTLSVRETAKTLDCSKRFVYSVIHGVRREDDSFKNSIDIKKCTCCNKNYIMKGNRFLCSECYLISSRKPNIDEVENLYGYQCD